MVKDSAPGSNPAIETTQAEEISEPPVTKQSKLRRLGAKLGIRSRNEVGKAKQPNNDAKKLPQRTQPSPARKNPREKKNNFRPFKRGVHDHDERQRLSHWACKVPYND